MCQTERGFGRGESRPATRRAQSLAHSTLYTLQPHLPNGAADTCAAHSSCNPLYSPAPVPAAGRTSSSRAQQLSWALHIRSSPSLLPSCTHTRAALCSTKCGGRCCRRRFATTTHGCHARPACVCACTYREALQTFSPRQLRLMFVLQQWNRPMVYGESSRQEMRAKEALLKNFFQNVEVSVAPLLPPRSDKSTILSTTTRYTSMLLVFNYTSTHLNS